jgi:hypothetical protein
MVGLARAIYSDTPGRDPSVLLDTDRFPTPETVEDHLLGSFIPTVYRQQPHNRRWDPERVHHWLGYLARHLDRLGTRDLAWWELGTTMRRSSRILVVGLVVAVVFGLIVLFEAPFDIRSAASPADLLRTNRTTVVLQLLIFGP